MSTPYQPCGCHAEGHHADCSIRRDGFSAGTDARKKLIFAQQISCQSDVNFWQNITVTVIVGDDGIARHRITSQGLNLGVGDGTNERSDGLKEFESLLELTYFAHVLLEEAEEFARVFNTSGFAKQQSQLRTAPVMYRVRTLGEMQREEHEMVATIFKETMKDNA